MRKSLTREERLKREKDFSVVFKHGKNVGCKGVRLFYIENSLPCNRFALTCKRGYGNAVQRNKAKRYGREIYRNTKSCLKTGFDIVVLFYNQGEFDFNDRKDQILFLLQRANLVN